MKTTKSLALVLACVIVFVTAFGCILPENVYAATVKMNQKSVILYLDDAKNSVTLKVLNGTGKVSWSRDLSKVVNIKSTGKRAAKVTALKPGRVTVTAKIGKKKYKCTVTVMHKSDEYNTLVNEAAKAVVTCKYKTLMNIAPKEETIQWIDSLGKTARRKIIGGECDANFWKNPDDFYLCTMGRMYATTIEQADQGYIYTTGIGLLPEKAKNGNYRIISEKRYQSAYSESKFENLKKLYAKNLGMEIQEARVIKCSYKCDLFDCKELHSKTFTLIKSGDKWFFSPYNKETMSKYNDIVENLTPEDTLYLRADKTSVVLNKERIVTVTIETGDYVGEYDLISDTTGCYGVECEWGEWIDDNKIELYIYPTEEYPGGSILISNSVNDYILFIRC